MKFRKPTILLFVVLVVVAAVASVTRSQQRQFNPRTVINRPFRPIVDAPVMSAADAAGKLQDSELVLGVVVEGQARAYPINMLTGPSREIINDTLGDTAIAATW